MEVVSPNRFRAFLLLCLLVFGLIVFLLVKPEPKPAPIVKTRTLAGERLQIIKQVRNNFASITQAQIVIQGKNQEEYVFDREYSSLTRNKRLMFWKKDNQSFAFDLNKKCYKPSSSLLSLEALLGSLLPETKGIIYSPTKLGLSYRQKQTAPIDYPVGEIEINKNKIIKAHNQWFEAESFTTITYQKPLRTPKPKELCK